MPQDPYLPPGVSQHNIPGDAAGDEEGDDVCSYCGDPVCADDDEAIYLDETDEIYCNKECMVDQRMAEHAVAIDAEVPRLGGDTQKIKDALHRAYDQGVSDAREVYDV